MSSVFDSITGVQLDDSTPTYLTDAQLGGGSTPSAWGGLDTLGSTTSNVASNIFSSLGNLVSAQINNTALLTATGKTAASLTAAKAASANAWHNYVLIAVALLAVGAGIYVLKK
jgi:hypothetical protein